MQADFFDFFLFYVFFVHFHLQLNLAVLTRLVFAGRFVQFLIHSNLL